MPLFGREKDEERTGFIGKVWETVSEFFKEQFRRVWEHYTQVYPEMIIKFFSRLGEQYTFVDAKRFEKIMEWFVKQGVIDTEDIKAIYEFSDTNRILKPFLLIFYVFSFLMIVLKVKMTSLSGTFQQRLNAKHTPFPPSPSDILRGAFIAPEKTGEIRDRIKASGLSDDDIDLMFLANYRLYAEDIIRVLYLRKEITEADMFKRMRELGYTDTRTKEILKAWPVIPSIQDIIYMSGKEAFEEDIIEHIGLDQEFPSAQVEWALKQGISEDWMKKYWYAHWDQPGIQQGYEMLHRQDVDRPGQTIISMEELDMLFRIVEIPPFWRERLTKIAYMPYTRVDVRRMHKVGVVSDEELVWAYRDQGYDIEHATKMAEFTIRYNMGTEKNITKTNVLTAYRQKAIDEAQAKELLLDLQYTVPATEFMLAYEDYKAEKSLQDDLIDNIRDKYQNNLIEKKDALSQLNAMNLPSKQVSLLMDKWAIKIYKDRKLPSKTDVSKWLINKVIDEDNFKWRMVQLGYSYDQIGHYLDYINKTKKTI